MGKASWYGPGFNGRPTATGEIYDQDQMTAASSIFPLGARVIVTDIGSGRAVEVRINDRGPFRKGRKIDLSYGAARALGMVAPGTALVRSRGRAAILRPGRIVRRPGQRREYPRPPRRLLPRRQAERA